jgi:hypothetical protein
MPEQYWYNIATQQVEQGHQSDWRNLMGPYPTREQAEQALQLAQANTERWDAEDREWNDWEGED